MKAGISTACLYPAETEKALEQLVARGFDHFEIFLNSFCELDDPVRGRLLALGRERDIVSLHPFSSAFETMLFFTEYPRRARDGLEMYKRFFDLAAEMGARYVIFHGAHRGMDLSFDTYAQRYEALHRAAAVMGVTLAHENVERSMSRDPELFRFLRRQIPDAAFTLDLKQAVRAGAPVPEMIDAMGGGLRHVHVSDADATRHCLSVGRGTLDFTELVAALEEKGFDGCLTLELYSHSYQRPEELEESVAFLQELINARRPR